MKKLFLVLFMSFIAVAAANAQQIYDVPSYPDTYPSGNNCTVSQEGGYFYLRCVRPVSMDDITAHTYTVVNGNMQVIDMDPSWVSVSCSGNLVTITVAPLTVFNRNRNATLHFSDLSGNYSGAWIISQSNPGK